MHGNAVHPRPSPPYGIHRPLTRALAVCRCRKAVLRNALAAASNRQSLLLAGYVQQTACNERARWDSVQRRWKLPTTQIYPVRIRLHAVEGSQLL